MKGKIDYKQLLDYYNGKYSYNDYLNIRQWFINEHDDCITEEQLFNQMKDISSEEKVRSLRPIFEKIQYEILLDEKRNERKITFWSFYRQIAAILIPLLGISALIYFFALPQEKLKSQSWLEINVPSGARVEFLLPDSTTGWLNSGAKLKYPAEFTQHRQVELSGEAYFNVKHHSNSDFTVDVADMKIKVLGTKFNVSAYNDETVSEVVLKEGKVEVNGSKVPFKQVLQPGEKITYDRTKNAINKLNVDPNIYTAWTKGYLVLDNEPLVEAAKRLERWYGIEILIKNDMLKKFRFKATFKEEPLEEVLQFIAMTTPITYNIENRSQGPGGLLKKKQVIMKLK